MRPESSHYLFRQHPETCDPEDIWGQVKRTVAGKPVPLEQINMIVDAIREGLQISPDDTLLDLCCGNGALTARVFEGCSGGLGVDYSDFLVDVAKRRFVSRSSERYLLSDALDYLREETQPGVFTKVLCYGAFPYFGEQAGREILETLRVKFDGATHVFLGQIPDKTRLKAFYVDSNPKPGEENDPGSVLGMWRSPDEMSDFAQQAGWKALCRNMPADFYSAHYRFDTILTRN